MVLHGTDWFRNIYIIYQYLLSMPAVLNEIAILGIILELDCLSYYLWTLVELSNVQVIPYIASHFRKDKIWLRRTKPNKRNYQVVVAIDDSRSMSESQCGNAAIEALVTVCRAMSQLEVGQFSVASFGKKGNVRLLHDFDQPFTGEAGVKVGHTLTMVNLSSVFVVVFCCLCICILF